MSPKRSSDQHGPYRSRSLLSTTKSCHVRHRADAEQEEDLDDDLGVLDFAVQAESGTKETAPASERLTEAAAPFTATATEKTKHTQTLARDPTATPKQKRQLADSPAQDLRTFVTALAEEGGQIQRAARISRPTRRCAFVPFDWTRVRHQPATGGNKRQLATFRGWSV